MPKCGRRKNMSVLDGKTLVALGDSLIHGNKLGPDATWVALLAERHGMKAYNYGINGNPVAFSTEEPTHKHPPMCVRYADMADGADYVVLLGGANDRRLHVPLGDEACRADRSYRDTSTFYGALNTLTVLPISIMLMQCSRSPVCGRCPALTTTARAGYPSRIPRSFRGSTRALSLVSVRTTTSLTRHTSG